MVISIIRATGVLLSSDMRQPSNVTVAATSVGETAESEVRDVYYSSGDEGNPQTFEYLSPMFTPLFNCNAKT